MIVDGRAIAKGILKRVREEAARLPSPPVVRAVSVAPSPATESYLRVKERRAKDAGMELQIVRLPDTAREDDVLIAFSAPADALLVQLPLPESMDSKRVLDAIPPEKDADVLSARAHEAFEAGLADALLPPVAGAVKAILENAGISPAGKRAVVVGSGWLVGEPCAAWLRSAGAVVVVVTKESGDLSALKDAELVVLGAGSPGLVKPEHLREGVALIDAGTSESDGSIVGDADPACAHVASLFTPVPGGVGPIAVACLYENALALAKRGRLQGG